MIPNLDELFPVLATIELARDENCRGAFDLFDESSPAMQVDDFKAVVQAMGTTRAALAYMSAFPDNNFQTAKPEHRILLCFAVEHLRRQLTKQVI